MVEAYWEVGRVIVEEEQAGKERADYGKRIIDGLSAATPGRVRQGLRPVQPLPHAGLLPGLPESRRTASTIMWTHYRSCFGSKPRRTGVLRGRGGQRRWSTRELERQINSLLFERLALSRDKAGVPALAQQGHEVTQPSDLVKDPLVLKFAGLRHDERFCESDLERALIARLQQFLLELGKGFAFMGRQQRITLDGRAFLHRPGVLQPPHSLLRLAGPQGGGADAPGPRTDADVRQLLPARVTAPDENPPIGIVLCTDKNEAVVRFSCPRGTPRFSRPGTSSICRPSVCSTRRLFKACAAMRFTGS